MSAQPSKLSPKIVALLEREPWLVSALEILSRHQQATMDFALVLTMGEDRGAHAVLTLDIPRGGKRQARSQPMLEPGALPLSDPPPGRRATDPDARPDPHT